MSRVVSSIVHPTTVAAQDAAAVAAPPTAAAAHSNIAMAGIHIDTMDVSHANLPELVNAVATIFAPPCLPNPLPIGHEGERAYKMDCVSLALTQDRRV